MIGVVQNLPRLVPVSSPVSRLDCAHASLNPTPEILPPQRATCSPQAQPLSRVVRAPRCLHRGATAWSGVMLLFSSLPFNNYCCSVCTCVLGLRFRPEGLGFGV